MLYESSASGIGVARSPATCISCSPFLKHGHFPWVAKTPDTSPVPWQAHPVVEADPARLPSPVPQLDFKLPSRDLLRAVCEPFFEQMITALQAAMVQQHEQQQQHETHQQEQHLQQWWSAPLIDSVSTNNDSQTACGPTSSASQPSSGSVHTAADEEAYDTDESGAFATLFSCPSSSGSCCDNDEFPLAFSPELPFQTASNPPIRPDLDSRGAQTKSVMVCRHWKAKGLCRMEKACKFQHPEEKRGPKPPKGGLKLTASASVAVTTNMDGDAISMNSCGRKRRSRGRKPKNAISVDHIALDDDSKRATFADALSMDVHQSKEQLS